METVHAIVLFVLGVGAAILAYFAWHQIFAPEDSSQTIIDTSKVIPFNVARPGIARQA